MNHLGRRRPVVGCVEWMAGERWQTSLSMSPHRAVSFSFCMHQHIVCISHTTSHTNSPHCACMCMHVHAHTNTHTHTHTQSTCPSFPIFSSEESRVFTSILVGCTYSIAEMACVRERKGGQRERGQRERGSACMCIILHLLVGNLLQGL